MGNISKKINIRSVSTLTIFLGLIVLFQNCSQQNQIQNSDVPTLSSGIQKITYDTSSLAENNVCLVENLKCYKNIYSANIANSFAESEKQCLIWEGKEYCLDLEVNTYNTSEAIAACTDCDKSVARYNREEVTCLLNVNTPGIPDFFALNSNLETALSETINSCRLSFFAKE